MSLFERVPPHGSRGTSRARIVAGSAAVVGLIAVVAGLAFAYWASNDSSNPAAASATSLSAPSASAAEASATSVRISWTAGSQPAGTTYVVVRNPGVNQVTVCTVPASMSTCTDSGLSAATTYSYSVTAELDAWRSSASTASFTTMGVTIATPVDGSTFGANWGGSISGTSSAATGSAISTVKVSIQQGGGSCWTGAGNAWTAACPNYVATGGTPSNWNLGLPAGDLNSVNTYHITGQATDSLSTSATATSSFTYNSSPPLPAAPIPTATTNFTDSQGVYWVNAETVALSDTVAYGGAGSVSSVAYYYCTTPTCTSSNGTFIGNGSGATWSFPWTSGSLPASDGTYYIVAVATDSLSSVGTSSTTELGVDRTPPTVSTPSVNGFQ